MTLADEINRMILKIVESLEITSANPTHINHVIQSNEMEKPDLEAMIIKGTTDEQSKQQKKTENAVKKLEAFDKGKVGEVQRMTSQHFGNLKDFARDPAGFIFQAFMKKIARGVGVIAFALMIFEAVKWIISELLKPGRLLDLRFKRDIRKEIIAFRRREEQQKLRQGFSSIIITSQPRLRGSPNQAAQTTNTLDFVRQGNVEAFNNIGQNPVLVESSGVSISKSKGRRTFGGPGR